MSFKKAIGRLDLALALLIAFGFALANVSLAGAAELVSSDAHPGVYLQDTSANSDDFRIGVDLGILSISIDTNDDNYRLDEEHLSDVPYALVMDADGDMGIGTETIPRGAVGQAKLAIHGSSANQAGIQTTTTQDNYPVLSIYSFAHDSSAINFDCYWNGSAYVSSDAGSNARIAKYGDWLDFRIKSGITAGQGVSGMGYGMRIHLTDGSVTLPYVYGIQVSGSTRALYIKDDGTLGYLASSIRYKENVRDLSAADTAWLYDLRPVVYDYKAPLEGKNQFGLIAEEVELVNPDMVSYARVLSYPEPIPGEQEQGEATVFTTDVPETVNYEKLIVPMLVEIQQLRAEIDAVKADIDALEAGE
ncbi:MAG: tail fiber domain-containing protein [Candidatus Hydrogenedentes bacterium]|nr:tail fiber domain-containing protein [Candidatus Hydrogenedentota bacterium]